MRLGGQPAKVVWSSLARFVEICPQESLCYGSGSGIGSRNLKRFFPLPYFGRIWFGAAVPPTIKCIVGFHVSGGLQGPMRSPLVHFSSLWVPFQAHALNSTPKVPPRL